MEKTNKELAVEMMCAFLGAVYSKEGNIYSFDTLYVKERLEYLYRAFEELDVQYGLNDVK